VDGILYNEILMRTIMKKYTPIILALFAMACSRDTTIQGPLLDDLYGEFSVLENFKASAATVDFSANETVLFECRFSKNVDWEIEIKGSRSGATKKISGKSNIIDASNGIWNGTTTILPMFKTEPCTAILRVPNENFADTLPINVLGNKTPTGFVVADFESGLNPGWTVFAQSGANMSFRIVQSDTAAQGNAYYDMGGQVPFDFLIGLLDFPSTAYQLPAYPLSENPNNVYFNVFLYKPAGITNEIILFQFKEDENGDGILQNNEDIYSMELRNLQVGWQQVSVRYSDLVTLVNGQPANPIGNGIKEPHKLRMVSLLFLAPPTSGYSQTWVDNIMFTENGPLEP
jgi:hypothetical protein